MPLSPGDHLGPYEILAPVGSGAMGAVYRAHDPRLGRDVAIKVLAETIATDPDRLRRFEHEAQAAAALNHPNLLAVYDIGQDSQHSGSPYIVSELLRGETLRERLQAESALPVRKAIDYAVQIANGLAAAHEKGIVHRDLKPENIFVTADDHIKILDFGLAKLTQAEEQSADASTAKTTPPGTQAGIVMGTMGYMSPEQVRGLAADRRSDIFSFGAILYEMLSGRRAFPGATAADVMSAILKDHPPELTVLDPRVPPILSRLVERCLEKSPVARFQSTPDLAFALVGLSSSSEIGSAPHTAVLHDRPSTPWTWIIQMALVLLVLLTIGAVMYLRPARSTGDTIKLIVPPPRGASNIAAANRLLSVSPDATRIVFPAAGADGTRLWLRALSAVEPTPVAGTEDGSYPFWSPDARTLAFFADGKLKKVDLDGGAAVTLCDAPQPAGGTWSANGTIVFSSAGKLFRISATGGSATALEGSNAGRAGSTFAFPVFLPDYRHLLYLDTGSGVGEAAIYAGALDAADRTLVVKAASNVEYAGGYLLFMRDSTLVAQPFDPGKLSFTGDAQPLAEQVQRPRTGAPRGAFAVSPRVLAYQVTEGGPGLPTDLVWLDRGGKKVGQLGERNDYVDVQLSPDGRRASVSMQDTPTTHNIAIFDVERGVSTRFTFDQTEDLATIWAPDGSHIVFNSRRKGHDDLYLKAASGTGADTPLLVDSFDKYPRGWTPDGRFILYGNSNLSVVGSQNSLWILPTFGDKKPYPILEAPSFIQYHGQFSRDGRWIAYTSNESGRNEVYAVSFPGLDHKTRISASGGNWARWRADGNEIFYIVPSPEGTLVSTTVESRSADLRVGKERPLFQARWRNAQGYSYDVSPDGQRFLVAALAEDPPNPPLTLVVNWLPALNK